MIKYFLDGRELISIDETQVNRQFRATFGWAPSGETPLNVADRKGRSLHIIAAQSKDNIIGYMLR